MTLKIVIDNLLYYVATGKTWSVAAYLAPSIAMKTHGDLVARPTPQWMLIAMIVVALPFAWIGVTMSVRRVADAGYHRSSDCFSSCRSSTGSR